jgi:hypothetical protein
MASATTMDFGVERKYEGFKDIKTLVDVGGGTGKTLETIISSYPHIRGINYDLPHVIADAPTIPGNRDFFCASYSKGKLRFLNILLQYFNKNR